MFNKPVLAVLGLLGVVVTPTMAAAFSANELVGTWRGSGTVYEAGVDDAQKVRCRMSGTTAGTNLTLRGKCSTVRGKGDVVLKLKFSGSAISGTWQTSGAKGLFNVSGELRGNGFQADLAPTNIRDHRGYLSISMKGKKRFVLIGRSKIEKGERSQITFKRK